MNLNRYKVVFTSICFFCCLLGKTFAIDQTVVINVDGIVAYITKFGFLASGTAQIGVFVNVPFFPLAIIGCSDHELNILTQQYNTISAICVDLSKVMCNVKFVANATSLGQTNFQQTIREENVLYFYLLNCNAYLGEITLHLFFVNPGGEHLSSEYIPLPWIFIVLCGVWLIFTFLWCVNWICHRSHGVMLHRVITAFPISKVIWTGFAIYYWKMLSLDGGLPVIVTIIYYGTFIISRMIFYGILLLIARGWGITIDHLGKHKWLVIGTMALVTLSLALGILLTGYFLLISFVLYILLLVLVFQSANLNLRDLSAQLAIPDHDPSCESRYQLYRLFKILMLAYVTIALCIVMADVLFLQNFAWIVVLLEETLDFVMFLCIGIKFRLRRINIYYKLPSSSNNSQLAAQQERAAVQQFVELRDKGMNVTMSNLNSDVDAVVVVSAPQNTNNVGSDPSNSS